MTQQTLVLVLTFGRKDFLAGNLDSLSKQTCRDFDLLIVDNKPSPEIKDLVKSRFPDATYAEMNKDLDRAGGFAWGINYAVMKNYHYLWLMEDDTEATPEALDFFNEKALKLGTRFSFLAPMILNSKQKADESNPTDAPDGFLTDYENIRNGLIRTTSCSFVSCFINIFAARHVGLPYMEFVCGAEDLEYAQRLVQTAPGYFAVNCVINHLSQREKSELQDCPESHMERAALMIRNKTWLYKGTKAWQAWENHLADLKRKIRKEASSTQGKRLELLKKAVHDGCRMTPVLIKRYSDDYESLRATGSKNSLPRSLLRFAYVLISKLHEVPQTSLAAYPLYIAKKTYWAYLNTKFEREANRRRQGWQDPRFLKLLSLKNAYFGKRCFVCATGPSMNIADLEKLKGEYTVGVNSICLTYTKTDWRPTFYGVSDRLVYKDLKCMIDSRDIMTFVGCNTLGKDDALPPEWILFPDNGFYHAYTMGENTYHCKFSEDCYATVYDCYTIVLNMIQILFYMGFKEIYLMGCDCNYKLGSKNHFIEGTRALERQEIDTAYSRLMTGYGALKEYADKHPDVKVFNSTRGGMLELFPRKSLEDVLASPRP